MMPWRFKDLYRAAFATATSLTLLSASTARAEAGSTEDMFQEVFVSAGYATAFGAALGAASLSLYRDPEKHLQSIAIGASLGFIGGSILGSYLVLAPVMTYQGIPESNYIAVQPNQRVQFSPIVETETMGVTGLVGSWHIADF